MEGVLVSMLSWWTEFLFFNMSSSWRELLSMCLAVIVLWKDVLSIIVEGCAVNRVIVEGRAVNHCGRMRCQPCYVEGCAASRVTVEGRAVNHDIVKCVVSVTSCGRMCCQ